MAVAPTSRGHADSEPSAAPHCVTVRVGPTAGTPTAALLMCVRVVCACGLRLPATWQRCGRRWLPSNAPVLPPFSVPCGSAWHVVAQPTAGVVGMPPRVSKVPTAAEGSVERPKGWPARLMCTQYRPLHEDW